MPYIVAALVIIIDQVTKAVAAAVLPTLPGGSFVLIDGVFELHYVKNTGAAWGMFSDTQLVLYIVSALVSIALLYFYIRNYKRLHTLIRYSLILIIAGAIGNLIDRFALFYVRDMLYFSLIDFPVFNVADMAVTIGATLLLIDILFLSKGKKLFDDMLNSLTLKKKNKSKPDDLENNADKISEASVNDGVNEQSEEAIEAIETIENDETIESIETVKTAETIETEAEERVQ